MSLLRTTPSRGTIARNRCQPVGIECVAIPMAVGTVVNQQQVINAALAAPVAEFEVVVKQSSVCNIDEPSWRQRGAQKRSWLWTVVTPQVTLFRIAPSRSGW